MSQKGTPDGTVRLQLLQCGVVRTADWMQLALAANLHMENGNSCSYS